MASVTLRGLAKTYDPGGTQAVADLSLDVRDGEFFVLLGPSGCGKTTVLRCIAGLETPSAGEIRIGDRDVTQLSPGERDVAMVFQSHALYPHLSAWGNIAFGLEVRGVAAAEIARRVEQAAQRLGLTGALERLPGALSGGERQRWPWLGQSCASPACFSTTSRSHTSTRLSAASCVPSCSSCTARSGSPSSTSRTIRSRR